MAAYLIGRDEDYRSALERTHQAHVDAGERVRAVRCAFWLGLHLLFRGETGRATGWLARARRLLERETRECANRLSGVTGLVGQQLAAGDCDPAYATAAIIAEIGERCGDADLIACARHQQGRIRLQQGQVQGGLALLDEVMVAVTATRMSPLVVTGLMYCSVIRTYREVYAFGRAGEWTAALARWCDEQPDMVAFTGVCRVHRAEIMQLHGDWQGAIEEAHRARERFPGGRLAGDRSRVLPTSRGAPPPRGVCRRTEEAYRSASRLGFEPQPGLGLMRLAQRRPTTWQTSAIRRIVSATTNRLLQHTGSAAHVGGGRVLIAGDIQEASGASRELEPGWPRPSTPTVAGAIAAQARGAVGLAAEPRFRLRSIHCVVNSKYRNGSRRLRATTGARADRDSRADQLRRQRGDSPSQSGADQAGLRSAVGSGTGPRPRSRPRHGSRPRSSRPWVDTTRATGAAPRRHREDEQGHCRRTVIEREDH